METRRQNTGFQCKIVQDFLKSIPDDATRLVCFLIMHRYRDAEITRQLHIKERKLQQIKNQIAFDLLKAGIRIKG